MQIEIAYMKLKDEVRKMLAAQKEYFRSGKDKQKLMIAKSHEKKVSEMIDPPAPKGKTLFDLGA